MAFRGRYLIPIALIAAIAPIPVRWVELAYSRTFYLSIQPYVTSASNLSPFALLDIAIALILLTGTVAFVRDRGLSGWRPALVRAAGRLAKTGALIYILFLVTWGLNYRRIPLEAKLDFDPSRITPEAAPKLAVEAIERLNAGYVAAHARPLSKESLQRAFAEAQLLLGAARIATTGRPKRSFAGLYFRYAAIDGMTVPVFLEVILNPDILPVEEPSVLAHEWAHLAGYADESEANFVAWITGVRSQDPVAQYSAWLDAYRLAAGALPRAMRGSLPPLNDGPRQDLRDIAARFERSSPRVRTAARGVYDSYLKANRIHEGIANYTIVLQLILGTAFEEGWTPRVRGG
ncbi:MAG: DUF3810 family protein [Acidobacteria bacterium]|nr:DUF3810 family protein [Acidobacteriota bacterium]